MLKKFICVLIFITLLAIPVCSYAMPFDAEALYNAVFVIYQGDSVGSGFAVDRDLIVTNAHVIDGNENITVSSYNGKSYAAHLEVIDKDFDIALLKVEDTDFHYLYFADSDNLVIGEDVYAIGAPGSMAYTLTKGVLSAKERKIGGYEYLQVDTALNPGNSGGPLLNDEGNVIGVNTLKIEGSEGIGLAIPSNDVRDFLKSNGVEVSGQDYEASVPHKTEAAVITKSPEAQSTVKSSAIPDTERQEEIVRIPLAFILVLIFSLAANVVLTILLIKKRGQPPHDPKDSTDFDIDLLE